MEEEEWNRVVCLNCNIKHSIFVCPKLHYMPYRNFIFLKSQKAKSLSQQRTCHDYTRTKPMLSKRAAVKMYRKIFKKMESVM